MLVDVGELEPAPPCSQSREGKTLNGFVVAYTKNHRNYRFPIAPKLYRVLAATMHSRLKHS
jgi:hypothetical protein